MELVAIFILFMITYYLFGSYVGLMRASVGGYIASGKTRMEVVEKLLNNITR